MWPSSETGCLTKREGEGYCLIICVVCSKVCHFNETEFRWPNDEDKGVLLYGHNFEGNCGEHEEEAEDE